MSTSAERCWAEEHASYFGASRITILYPSSSSTLTTFPEPSRERSYFPLLSHLGLRSSQIAELMSIKAKHSADGVHPELEAASSDRRTTRRARTHPRQPPRQAAGAPFTQPIFRVADSNNSASVHGPRLHPHLRHLRLRRICPRGHNGDVCLESFNLGQCSESAACAGCPCGSELAACGSAAEVGAVLPEDSAAKVKFFPLRLGRCTVGFRECVNNLIFLFLLYYTSTFFLVSLVSTFPYHLS
ncbi:hypothetical protein B0H16DRAFT_1507747 [Mycena metata]|uniref:Uncharacterized protein n=1 Tax=Mycena metata TaxID=1033252 RepID=A0AAD7NUS5_9AGAR|nr:hypothetical protein B0H16DRAFT_1507747 [Mycena metata]